MDNLVELIKTYIESENKVRLAESRRFKKKIMELETRLYEAENAISDASTKEASDKAAKIVSQNRNLAIGVGLFWLGCFVGHWLF